MYSMIWIRNPKNVFVEINTLHFGEHDAIATYDRGNIIKCEVLQRLGLTRGEYMISAMLYIYNERKRHAQRNRKECERLTIQRMKGIKR